MLLISIVLTSSFLRSFEHIVVDFFAILILTFEVGEELIVFAIIFKQFIEVIFTTQVLIFCIQLDDGPIAHFHID